MLLALWQACAEVLDDAPAAAVGNEPTAVPRVFDAPATAADWQAEGAGAVAGAGGAHRSRMDAVDAARTPDRRERSTKFGRC